MSLRRLSGGSFLCRCELLGSRHRRQPSLGVLDGRGAQQLELTDELMELARLLEQRSVALDLLRTEQPGRRLSPVLPRPLRVRTVQLRGICLAAAGRLATTRPAVDDPARKYGADRRQLGADPLKLFPEGVSQLVHLLILLTGSTDCHLDASRVQEC